MWWWRAADRSPDLHVRAVETSDGAGLDARLRVLALELAAVGGVEGGRGPGRPARAGVRSPRHRDPHVDPARVGTQGSSVREHLKRAGHVCRPGQGREAGAGGEGEGARFHRIVRRRDDEDFVEPAQVGEGVRAGGGSPVGPAPGAPGPSCRTSRRCGRPAPSAPRRRRRGRLRPGVPRRRNRCGRPAGTGRHRGAPTPCPGAPPGRVAARSQPRPAARRGWPRRPGHHQASASPGAAVRCPACGPDPCGPGAR